MLTALLQMVILVACGSFWSRYAPDHISSLAHRRAITDLVFYILLPALVLDIIWRTPLGVDSLYISLAAMAGIAMGLGAMWCLLLLLKPGRQQRGALLLAAAFPNSTYLGLPVLNQVIGPESRAVVLQYDLFACTPVLLSFGILLAQHYSPDQHADVHPLKTLIKVPPLWAVVLGVMFNLTGIPQPAMLHSSLSLLAGAVVPLMLIVLGMSIRWRSLHLRYMTLLVPVALVSLLLVPYGVNSLGTQIGLAVQLQLMTTLIAAMPTMVFGIVICERYHLDSALYAAAVTFTTLCCLVTLPLWYQLLTGG